MRTATAITFAALGIVSMSIMNPLRAEELRGEALMAELKKGGYTLVVRHARTDRTVPTRETPGSVPPLRADQRNLTADGIGDVRLMQAAMQRHAIPISEVWTSPVYRCRETADAFGPPQASMALRVFPTTRETMALLAAVPKPGTNRVLVTHHFVLESLVPGIAVGDIGESEAAVIRPLSPSSVELAGRIELDDWKALAGDWQVPQEPLRPATAFTRHDLGVHADAARHHGRDERHDPQTPHATAVAIPATPVGRLASGYLAAFNSGNAETMRAFIESSLVADPERPIAQRVASYRTLFHDHGTITITGIQRESDETLALLARSKRGNLIVTVTASHDPQRAQSVAIGVLQGGHGH